MRMAGSKKQSMLVLRHKESAPLVWKTQLIPGRELLVRPCGERLGDHPLVTRHGAEVLKSLFLFQTTSWLIDLSRSEGHHSSELLFLNAASLGAGLVLQWRL
jgi:hypothetical protein